MPRLTVGEQRAHGLDAPPGHYHEASKGYSVSIGLDDPQEAERIFEALAEGGNGTACPSDTTFWAARFGMLADRFGIPWMINCEEPR